jgi:pimeloyl-ACP methyl ester carboxylesterase
MGASQSAARRIACGPICAIWLLFLGGCATPINVERIDIHAVHRELTANVLTADQLSQSARNVLRRWVLSERFDSNPEEAITALHAIVVKGSGGVDELMALAEMAFLHAQTEHKPGYYLAAAIYSYAFLFPEKSAELPNQYDPRFRLAADLYNRSITNGFKSADGITVELKGGSYELPFGKLDVAFDPSMLEIHGRKVVALTPLADFAIHGLTNRYRQAGIGAALAATTHPIVSERGMQVAPRARVPVTALLRLDAPRRQLAQKDLHAELDLYNDYDVSAVTIAGQRVPLEADESATLALTLSSPELWASERAAFFSGTYWQAAPTQLASIDGYRPGRIPVVFVHGTASSSGRWANMVNDLLDDPTIRDRFQFWFFAYDTGNPVLYSAAKLRDALRDAVDKLDPGNSDPALSEMVVIGHSQGGLLTKALVVDSGDQLWDAIANEPFDDIELTPKQRNLLRKAMFIKPLPYVRRVVFIATPHRGSYLTDYSITGVLRYFLSLPAKIRQLGADLETENANDFKIDLRKIRSGSLFGMSAGNPVVQVMSALPIAPGVRAHSIIGVPGNGPIEDSDDGVVDYKSSHLAGVESEFIVKSGHSMQANPYTIEEVRHILFLHAADVCARIACGKNMEQPKPVALMSR